MLALLRVPKWGETQQKQGRPTLVDRHRYNNHLSSMLAKQN